MSRFFPVIDSVKTGSQIQGLLEAHHKSVKDVQRYLNLEYCQCIYKWLKGLSIPSIDHLLALSVLFGVPMEEILCYKMINEKETPRDDSRGDDFFCEDRRSLRTGESRRSNKLFLYFLPAENGFPV